MMFARIERLREAVATASGARPSWVGLMFVRHLGGRRIDLRFEWISGKPSVCIVHTDHTSARRAIRQVVRVAESVRPGVRFRADNPDVTAEIR